MSDSKNLIGDELVASAIKSAMVELPPEQVTNRTIIEPLVQQKIENEAAIAKAEADKRVAITNAEAEAEKTAIRAEAQAEANRKLTESLSDELIEYQKIQKWDGKLPAVTGGNSLWGLNVQTQVDAKKTSQK